MKSFELHVFRDGAWKIDAIFDDAELALLEARRADEARRYASIRVIEERYDEETDRTTIRTLFRGGVISPRTKVHEAPAARKPAAPATGGAAGHEGELAYRPPPRRNGAAPLTSILLLILIVAGGGAALYGLHLFGR